MTGRSQRCWPIRQVRRVSSATHSFEHFFGGVQLKWALFWANDWNLTLLSNPLFFEHFFELITHKSTFLSALLINETFLNTFLRTQKSGFALKSAFLSGFTLLRAFLSAQKSAQGPAEPLCATSISDGIFVCLLLVCLFVLSNYAAPWDWLDCSCNCRFSSFNFVSFIQRVQAADFMAGRKPEKAQALFHWCFPLFIKPSIVRSHNLVA